MSREKNEEKIGETDVWIMNERSKSLAWKNGERIIIEQKEMVKQYDIYIHDITNSGKQDFSSNSVGK